MRHGYRLAASLPLIALVGFSPPSISEAMTGNAPEVILTAAIRVPPRASLLALRIVD